MPLFVSVSWDAGVVFSQVCEQPCKTSPCCHPPAAQRSCRSGEQDGRLPRVGQLGSVGAGAGAHWLYSSRAICSRPRVKGTAPTPLPAAEGGRPARTPEVSFDRPSLRATAHGIFANQNAAHVGTQNGGGADAAELVHAGSGNACACWGPQS